MSSPKKIISIKKVLKSFLGKTKAQKYLKGTEIVFSNTLKANSMDIYQYALKQLLEGETETAINCIAFALDFDRENKLILHLCKSMLVTITQYLSENRIEEYRVKYPDFEESINKFSKKIKELEKIIKNEEYELERIEKQIYKSRKNPIFILFKKRKLQAELQSIKNNISNYNNELEVAKNEFNKLKDLYTKEEYAKVIGLIIEVCIFPSKFDSDLTKTNYF
ncbi:MAG: hypothetical protein KatS3mg068_1006 [Candidatus Sericytochromatia bacterium]|nr:MAG: hypothetical protein KatS3mg068_1006 [Candidatus Sericytochromatia bacterium]